MYSSDFATLNSFTSLLKVSKLFPQGGKSQTIGQQQFMSLIRQLDYLFVSSEAIRREYTNYVLIQKQQILENVTHTANQSYAASTYGGNQLDASGQSFRQSVQYGKMKPGKRSAQGSERDHMIALNKENHGIRGSIAADKQRFSEMESASKTSKTKKKDKKEKKMKKKKSKKETHLLDSD